jgi:hypothetical protein
LTLGITSRLTAYKPDLLCASISPLAFWRMGCPVT